MNLLKISLKEIDNAYYVLNKERYPDHDLYSISRSVVKDLQLKLHLSSMNYVFEGLDNRIITEDNKEFTLSESSSMLMKSLSYRVMRYDILFYTRDTYYKGTTLDKVLYSLEYGSTNSAPKNIIRPVISSIEENIQGYLVNIVKEVIET